MKITLLVSSLSGGGAERVVANLANFLAKRGHEVSVLTTTDLKTYPIDPAVRHVVMYGGSNTRLPHAAVNVLRLIRMNRYLRKEKMDVYVTFLPKLHKFLLAQRGFVKAPIVLAERCDPASMCRESNEIRRDFQKYYGLADGYAFQTEDAKAYYAQAGMDVTNSTVIPNAINPAFVRPAYTGERTKQIVAAGRLNSQKNFPLLLRAFAKIADKYPEHGVTIYGQGDLLEQLKALAQELGISQRVSFPGYVTDLPDQIQKAALFVLPSDYEGMPNALMEAMAMGVPSISTDCPAGGSKFLIQDGVNGKLVPVGDADALAKAMDALLADPEKANAMGREARKICDQLQADRIYGLWEDFLKKIAQTGKKEKV